MNYQNYDYNQLFYTLRNYGNNVLQVTTGLR